VGVLLPGLEGLLLTGTSELASDRPSATTTRKAATATVTAARPRGQARRGGGRGKGSLMDMT
jgi:hypothetical protein